MKPSPLLLSPEGKNGPERNRAVNEVSDGYVGSETAKQWLDQVMMEV